MSNQSSDRTPHMANRYLSKIADSINRFLRHPAGKVALAVLLLGLTVLAVKYAPTCQEFYGLSANETCY